MRPNPVKAKLRAGEPVVGVFCNVPAPLLVEILGWLGYDFAILDAEHGSPSVETVEHLVRAAELSDTIPVARIALNLQQNILRYLDAGCMGVQIPLVNTGDQAQAVVNSVKYPPRGQRGLAGVRAATFGITQSLTDYVAQANRETLVTVQVETVQAMDNLDDILAVEGVDVVFIGPTDLSSSMGYPGQPTHPEVIKTITDLGKRIVKAGRAAGTIARDPQAFKQWRDVGFQYLCTGATNFFVQSAKAHLDGCRQTEATPS